MNPMPPQSSPRPAWQDVLASSVRDTAELLSLLELTPAEFGDAHGLQPYQVTSPDFPLLVPRPFVARMRPRDPYDPLLLQVLPLSLEAHHTPGFVDDPVGDLDAMVSPGVLHKYAGRVLLLLTGACSVHCRYCFRRAFPYDSGTIPASLPEAALQYIESNTTIEEVILSGGDPLAVSDAKLMTLCDRLARVPHLRRLRVHTRMPVIIPQRVTLELLSALTNGPLLAVMVIHANHGNEIDTEVAAALKALRDAGVIVLNQAVLLRRVNDSVEALRDLSERLATVGVLPYYLHLLDRVTGTAHFEVSVDMARELLTGLLRSLPGYLVPRLVREVKGLPFKDPVDCCRPPGL